MPPRKWKFRIGHILEAIAKIQAYTADMSLDDFVANDLVLDAVLRNFTIIGEATRHVPSDVTATYSDIPWRLMQDMRNVVVHDYPNVHITVVWDTIQNDLPSLVEPLRKLLDETVE